MILLILALFTQPSYADSFCRSKGPVTEHTTQFTGASPSYESWALAKNAFLEMEMKGENIRLRAYRENSEAPMPAYNLLGVNFEIVDMDTGEWQRRWDLDFTFESEQEACDSSISLRPGQKAVVLDMEFPAIAGHHYSARVSTRGAE
ncbi:MAG: hypothetical protein ACXWQO_08975 [Bdellovibrionota bacterium]